MKSTRLKSSLNTQGNYDFNRQRFSRSSGQAIPIFGTGSDH